MFERFTSQARAVVVRSQDEARAMGHRFIGTEHLLLGLLDDADQSDSGQSDSGQSDSGQSDSGQSYPDRGGAAATVLWEAGVRAEAVRQRIRQLVSGAGGDIDADALRSIGIDLDVVRDQVERTFGPGALDAPVPVEPKRGFLRRRQGSPKGHIPFSDRAKMVLGLSVREATGLGHGYIGTEHILLGLLREGQGLGAKVLFDAGVDLAALRQRTIDRAA